jgi:hypothetical protein
MAAKAGGGPGADPSRPTVIQLNASQLQGGQAMSPEALEAWVRGVVAQVEGSELMNRVIRIEQKVQAQVKDGLLHYYVDERDRAVGKCEGALTVVDPSELDASHFVVYFFGVALRDNLLRTGVAIPNVKISIASSLPQPLGGMSAFRNSYHFDGRTLFIRDSRLKSIGEFCVVLIHALAHIKVSRDPMMWDDSSAAFLKEFYGMVELTTEEMFFVRLPASKAAREPQATRADYRPESIMSAKSLGDIENQLRRVSRSEREAFLRTFLQM